jgi:hypothetical protein
MESKRSTFVQVAPQGGGIEVDAAKMNVHQLLQRYQMDYKSRNPAWECSLSQKCQKLDCPRGCSYPAATTGRLAMQASDFYRKRWLKAIPSTPQVPNDFQHPRRAF